jgi:NAD(P)-dependent dehydrogenase (short-subunit alcohol dehydrogenase family)
LQIVVNNAAVDHDEPLLEATAERSVEPFRTNLDGSLRMLQAGARAMRDRGGAIVNVSSRLVQVGVPGMSVYSAAKGALSALTRGAAIDRAPRGIRVNAVAPGFTETPLLSTWLAEQGDPAAARAEARALPCHSAGWRRRTTLPPPSRSSPATTPHVTGASLLVDGGDAAR